jgi:hypothetical protein
MAAPPLPARRPRCRAAADDHLDLLAVDPAVVDRTLLVSSYCDYWFDGIRRDHTAPMLSPLPRSSGSSERVPGASPRRPGRIELRTAARRLVGRLARRALMERASTLRARLADPEEP